MSAGSFCGSRWRRRDVACGPCALLRFVPRRVLARHQRRLWRGFVCSVIRLLESCIPSEPKRGAILLHSGVRFSEQPFFQLSRGSAGGRREETRRARLPEASHLLSDHRARRLADWNGAQNIRQKHFSLAFRSLASWLSIEWQVYLVMSSPGSYRHLGCYLFKQHIVNNYCG